MICIFLFKTDFNIFEIEQLLDPAVVMETNWRNEDRCFPRSFDNQQPEWGHLPGCAVRLGWKCLWQWRRAG